MGGDAVNEVQPSCGPGADAGDEVTESVLGRHSGGASRRSIGKTSPGIVDPWQLLSELLSQQKVEVDDRQIFGEQAEARPERAALQRMRRGEMPAAGPTGFNRTPHYRTLAKNAR